VLIVVHLVLQLVRNIFYVSEKSIYLYILSNNSNK
jgi:hypothetical protein